MNADYGANENLCHTHRSLMIYIIMVLPDLSLLRPNVDSDYKVESA